MENQVPLNSNRFTLAAYGTNPSLDNNWLRKRGRPWCDHSRKPGHTKGILIGNRKILLKILASCPLERKRLHPGLRCPIKSK